VKFWSGHPKNNLRIQSTYLEVQAYRNGIWTVIATDRDWETKYMWERVDLVWGTSRVTVQWTIPAGIPSGTYRIRHYGEYLNGWNGRIYSYTGTSKTFTVQ
jgi:neutral ceramidase